MKPAYSLMLLLLIPSAVVAMEQDPSNNNSNVDSPSSVRSVTRVVSRSDSQIPQGTSGPLATSPRSSSYSMMPGMLSRAPSTGVAALARTSSSDLFRTPEIRIKYIRTHLLTGKVEQDFLHNNKDFFPAVITALADSRVMPADKALKLMAIVMNAEDRPGVDWARRVKDLCKNDALSSSARFSDLPPAHEMRSSQRPRSGATTPQQSRSRSSSTADQTPDQK